MDKHAALIPLVLVFLLSACVTNTIPVPGSSEKIRTNIYTEYMNIGDSYFSLEKYDKAATYYEYAMGSRSLYWAAYYKCARSYALQGTWAKAEPMYKTLLKKDPENAGLRASLAYIYAAQGNRTKKAAELYKTLIADYPENPEYRENYIAVLIAQEKAESAAQQLQELKDAFPENKKITALQEAVDRLNGVEKPEPEDEPEPDDEASDGAQGEKAAGGEKDEPDGKEALPKA